MSRTELKRNFMTEGHVWTEEPSGEFQPVRYDLKGKTVIYSNDCLGCLVPAHPEVRTFLWSCCSFIKEKTFCGLADRKHHNTLQII